MESTPLQKLNIKKILREQMTTAAIKRAQQSTSSSGQKDSEVLKSNGEPPEVVVIDDESDRDKKAVEDDEDDEYGLISAVEQARQLLAASKGSLRKVNKPLVESKSSNKRPAENAPTTPGKQKRVELITLSSPKTKIK